MHKSGPIDLRQVLAEEYRTLRPGGKLESHSEAEWLAKVRFSALPFSADTWTLVATVVRNIILNWLVLVPILMFALMIPRLLLSVATIADAYLADHGTADPMSTSPV